MVIIVSDPDAAFDRAVTAGATVVTPMDNQYGWRLESRGRSVWTPLGDRQAFVRGQANRCVQHQKRLASRIAWRRFLGRRRRGAAEREAHRARRSHGARRGGDCAQILPSDEGPGAREAGVVYFIDRALATFDSDKREAYRKGMAEFPRLLRRWLRSSRSRGCCCLRKPNSSSCYVRTRCWAFWATPATAGIAARGLGHIGFEHRMAGRLPSATTMARDRSEVQSLRTQWTFWSSARARRAA